MADLRPNIIIVALHDLGCHLNCCGAATAPTPNIDRVWSEGVRFDQHYGTSSLCSPSRSSIVTGRYPHANGMNGLTHRGFRLNDSERVLADYFNEAGYATRLFGFQHEAKDVTRMHYQEAVKGLEGTVRCADVAPVVASFLESEPPQPFLASVGFSEVHRPFKGEPYTPADPAKIGVPAYLPDCAEVREDLADFAGLIAAADEAMAAILAALDKSGLAENTILIFTTDHGIAFPRAKSTLYDPGIGVALMVRWPARVKGGRVVNSLSSHVDLLPTLLDIAGQAIPRAIQGMSMKPLLLGKGGPTRGEIFAEKSWHGSEYDPMRCIRTTKFKYIRNFTEGWLYQSPLDIKRSLSGRAAEESRRKPRAMTELYDLEREPLEMDSRSGDADYAEIESDLDARLTAWMEDTADPLPDKHIPFPCPAKEHFLDNKSMPMPED